MTITKLITCTLSHPHVRHVDQRVIFLALDFTTGG